VESLFKNTRVVLLCASACMKPTDTEFGTMVKPFYDDLGAVTKIKDEMRSNREWSMHFQVVADGAPCVGWIQVVRPLPVTEICARF
jgi:adenylyl cyclase-associated protein